LTLIVVISLVGVAGWGTYQLTRAPAFAGAPTTPADGVRAQQKIFDVLRRSGSGRPHTVTLSEREVNAFLGRHLGETADVPLRNLVVRLPDDGHADIAGQIALRRLLASAPFSALAGVLPEEWLDSPVWLALRARVTLEGGSGARARRYLRLDVERFWIGRQRLPALTLRLLLDLEALRLLRSPMPEAIDGLRVEPGRLVIQSGS
jgi:hypothetical protein